MIVETGDLRPMRAQPASRLDAAAGRGRRRPHHRDGWRRGRVPARWTRRRGCRQARRLGAGRRRDVRRARCLPARQPARELRSAAVALARARLRCRPRQTASRTGSTACSPMARRRSPTARHRHLDGRDGSDHHADLARLRPWMAAAMPSAVPEVASSSAAETGAPRSRSPITCASSPGTGAHVHLLLRRWHDRLVARSPAGASGSVANAEMAYAVADDAIIVGTGSDVVASLLATHRGRARSRTMARWAGSSPRSRARGRAGGGRPEPMFAAMRRVRPI